MVKIIITGIMLMITTCSYGRDITKPISDQQLNVSSIKQSEDLVKKEPLLQGVYISPTTKKVLINNIWMEEKDKVDNIRIISISVKQVKMMIDHKLLIVKHKELEQ